jgi:uncharacterized protein DUF4235
MGSRSADREGMTLPAHAAGRGGAAAGHMDDTGDEAAMKKPIYRLASLGLSVVSGMLAGVMFKQLWKLIAREDEAPEATDPERSWREVLPAAALQGAVFATVKAAVERGAVQGGRKLAGSSQDG